MASRPLVPLPTGDRTGMEGRALLLVLRCQCARARLPRLPCATFATTKSRHAELIPPNLLRTPGLRDVHRGRHRGITSADVSGSGSPITPMRSGDPVEVR